MMFRSFLLQALFGSDGGRSTKDSGGGYGGGINTTGNTSTAFPKGVGADEMNSSFPSFSSPSTPSSYSKRKKVVLLVFFCILFGGIFFLFGAFEIVRGMTTMSSSASLGESSIQQQMVYKRSDEKNRGWKGEDEEGEDDEDDDAIETNARDRRREYDAESRTTTTRMSESEEMIFQTRLASASEKCLRAPYPQVLGDNGETLKRAQRT